jgi:hypothetical protein
MARASSRRTVTPTPARGTSGPASWGGSWTLINPDYDFPFAAYVDPTNAFTIGQVKGTKVELTLPGRGGGAVTVRARLTKRGKRILRAGGKLKAAITFTPEGGQPDTLSAKLKRRK